MNITGRVKRFVLFTSPNATERKAYVRSFNTQQEAVAAALALKKDAAMRWQVVDNQSSKVAAEDPGIQPPTAAPGA